MSCFLVSDDHISAICTFAGCMRGARLPQHKELFRLLKQANLLALGDRYGDEAEEAAGKIALVPVPVITVIKACHCLEYQCSDWSGWAESDAKKYLDWIERAAVNALPGYDEAPWGIPPGAAKERNLVGV